MSVSASDRSPSNMQLGREVAAYAERCAAFGPPRMDLPGIRRYWQSRYLLADSAADLASRVVAHGPDFLNTPGLFVTLSEREAAVAMRCVAALAGISCRQIRAGLSDSEFMALTSAIRRFQDSAMQVRRVERADWSTTVKGLIESLQPPWLLVDGIAFGCGLRASQFERAAHLIEIAATHECRLLLFD